jgi:hypothetical protein
MCTRCWDTQVAHRKTRLAPRGIPHEKTQLNVARQLQTVFFNQHDDETFQKLHQEDEGTIWFGESWQDVFSGFFVLTNLLGVDQESRIEENAPLQATTSKQPALPEREGTTSGPVLFFRDHGRYAELIATTNADWLSTQPSIERNNGHNAASNRTPSLVSFVGQTGAGKSTLIKLMIQLSPSSLATGYPSPVVGVPEKELPTSADVHLYVDPSTASTNSPLLYADCEGLDAGEREPLAATYRKKDGAVDFEESTSVYPPHYSKRELRWATSQAERTRDFAVSQLYPRLLFTFSDVIVFVHRNPR